MDSSSGFGSTPGDKRAIHTRFRCGSGCDCLNRPPRVTRRIILQKARRQPVLTNLGLRLHVSRRFQGLFHSPRRGTFHRSLTVLCAIGRCVYVALGSGLPSFTPDCSCPVLLKYQSWGSIRVSYPAVTVFGDAFQTSSDTDLVHQWITAVTRDWTYNPQRATPAGLTHHRFRLLPVRSPLLREYFLFLGVHEMFQFPRCPPHRLMRSSSSRRWGCPIRRSWDHSLLAAPPRLSQLCHVLHRHAAPRHPPSAHTVFPAGRLGVDRSRSLGCSSRRCRPEPHPQTLCTW
jgi:hypothetical protein